MYKRLYSEHLQLKRAFALLRRLVAESHGHEKTAKILSWAEEKQKLQNMIESLKRMVDQLTQELKEAQDLNELLEFRFLELQQCQLTVTEDDHLLEKGVNTDLCIGTENILDFEDVVKKFGVMTTKKLELCEDKSRKQLLKENKLLKETILKLNTSSARESEEMEMPVFSEPHNEVFQEVEKELLKKQYMEVCKACDYLKDKLHNYERLNNELVGKLAAVEKSKQELEENNLQLHIDFMSAREHVQRLLQQDHRPCFHSTSDEQFRIDKSEEVPKEPDSLGTATSEDEGLGDDSRKGDSTGPSSLVDLQETVEDLLTKPLDINFVEENDLEHPDLTINLDTTQEFQQMRSEFGETNNLRRNENQLSERRDRSKIFLVELTEKLEVEKKLMYKTQSGNCIAHYNNPDEINKWEMEIEQPQATFKEDKKQLQEELLVTQVKKYQLQPQLLESEKVENDDTCREEKLQEQIDNLLKKQKTLTKNLSEKNMSFEIAFKQFRVMEATKNELRSQIAHMEVLLQNCKADIQNLKGSETKLRQKILKLERSLLHLLSAATHQNCDSLMCFSDFQLVKTINSDPKLSCGKSSVEIQVDISPFNTSQMMLEKFTQTLEDLQARFDADNRNPAINTVHKIFNPFLCSFFEVRYEEQKDLLFYFKHKDFVLKKQSYQPDSFLWKKLHDLKNHRGTFNKNNINSVIISLPCPKRPEEKEHKTPVCLLTIGKYDTLEKKVQISLHFQLKIISVTTKGILEQRREYLLSSMLTLERSQEKFEERFCKLERMKYENEKEVERKERFYKKKAMQQQKWKLDEMSAQKNIQTLNGEKPLFLENASSSDLENLEINVKCIQQTLKDLKNKHTRKIEDLEHRHNHAIANLSNKINGLEKTVGKIKDKITRYNEEAKITNNKLIQQISNVSSPVRRAKTKNNEQNCFEEHLEKVKEALKSQLELLKSEGARNEPKLKKELIDLHFQNLNLDNNVSSRHKKYIELEKKITFKPHDFELCSKKYKYSVNRLEEEHHMMETKLKLGIKRIGEYIKTYVNALKEEKEKLEASLQNVFDDHHFKEGYEFRISELEKHIMDLKIENDKVTKNVYFFKVPNVQMKKNVEKYHLHDMKDNRIRELENIEADLRLEVTRLRQCLSASNSHLEDLDCVRRNQEHIITRLKEDKASLQDELLQLRSSSGKSQELFYRIIELEEDKAKLLKRIETIHNEEWREGFSNINPQLQQQETKEMYDVGTMTEDLELKSGFLDRSMKTMSKESSPSTKSDPKRPAMRKAETVETFRHNVKCDSTSYDTSSVANNCLKVSDIGSVEELDVPCQLEECVMPAILVLEEKLENKVRHFCRVS
ncbi:uncharacterized protein LOC143229145 [Tachypleus tridentatus]|uniref:uncharacterized protein LOC143229145 n=1 Tax=Tachypleus tridentatus TaxID=6853 RepID=UPI003FD2D84A